MNFANHCLSSYQGICLFDCLYGIWIPVCFPMILITVSAYAVHRLIVQVSVFHPYLWTLLNMNAIDTAHLHISLPLPLWSVEVSAEDGCLGTTAQLPAPCTIQVPAHLAITQPDKYGEIMLSVKVFFCTSSFILLKSHEFTHQDLDVYKSAHGWYH